MLPVPTLVLQQQTDIWHLLCTGSPAYPGAVFSLYLADKDLPVATYHAKVIHHEAAFPVPVQDTSVASYQCLYSVLLGRKWSDSERSLPLAVTKGRAICLSYMYVVWSDCHFSQNVTVASFFIFQEFPLHHQQVVCQYVICGFNYCNS